MRGRGRRGDFERSRSKRATSKKKKKTSSDGDPMSLFRALDSLSRSIRPTHRAPAELPPRSQYARVSLLSWKTPRRAMESDRGVRSTASLKSIGAVVSSLFSRAREDRFDASFSSEQESYWSALWACLRETKRPGESEGAEGKRRRKKVKREKPRKKSTPTLERER